MHNGLFITASASGACAVIFGAFGAHALDGRLSADAMAVYHTAVDYHFYHTAALLGAALLPCPGRCRMAAGLCLVFGTLIFSGSLYALVLSGITKLGMITPVGGLLLIAGWVLLAVCAANTARPRP